MTDILTTIGDDIKTAWGDLETLVVDDAEVAWNAIKTIWLKLAPAEWVTIQGLIKEALADVEDGDFADIETSVLLKAEASGATFVAGLGSAAIQAIIGIFKSNVPA